MAVGSALSFFQTTLSTEVEKVKIPFWRRYDGQQGWTRLPVLSDLARSLLQEARMDRFAADGTRKGFSLSTAERTLSKYMKDPTLAHASSTLQGSLDSLGVLAAFGAYCAVCGKLGDAKKCGGCEWETYCSVEHQREDKPLYKCW